WLRLGSTDDRAVSAVFSPTGRQVLVGTQKRLVQVLDLASRKEERKVQIPARRLESVDYDAAGVARPVGASGGSVEFWDVLKPESGWCGCRPSNLRESRSARTTVLWPT